jgi:hypothetical protein
LALLGLGEATDDEAWSYALDQGLVIVSKDLSPASTDVRTRCCLVLEILAACTDAAIADAQYDSDPC